MKTETLKQRLDAVKLLMEYAVPKEHLEEATSLVEKHGADTISLNIFHTFYSYLPEAHDDYIKMLRLLARKEGTFLVCVSTGIDDYLYLATNERAEFLGPHAEGIYHEEVLHFFGFINKEAFIKAHKDLSRFPVYVPAHLHGDLCPLCLTAEGEYHTLGCPVEVCPWCEGQLTNCNCRFSQLGAETLTKDKQIDIFQKKLNKKGRIPFNAAHQRPGYPSDGKKNGSGKDN